MKACLTLKPYQRGTKKLSRQYGDRLLYVRYRYDPVRKKRITTVELIVEEVNWNPRATFAANQCVDLQVGVTERDVQKRVKQAGGLWNQQRKVWELRYDAVVAFGLTDGVVGEVEALS